MGWKILFTNNTLAGRAGTELWVRDVALALRARGHAPAAFSTVLGDVAAELGSGGVEVVDDLDALGAAPDLIHGHHHLETTIASLRFPRAPVLSFCHGLLPWEELPARLPTVARYVAVDLACRDRLVVECGIPPGEVSLLFNFVDLARFRPRPPLPQRPRRALAFGNPASERTFLPALRAACAARGIALDAAGEKTRVLERPEEALGAYDLVFAKGRAAMEAMATGCAVVLCDLAGAGPLVTSAAFERLRPLNFGLRALVHPLTAAHLGGEIDLYDAADAARVRDLMRAAGDLEKRLDELLALYAATLAAPRPTLDPGALAVAASRYLRWLAPRVKDSGRAQVEAGLRARLEEAERAAAAHEKLLETARQELERAHREPGLRLQLAATRLPIIGGALRALGRLVFGSAPPPGR
ncbi:MAG TPA: glycosyltransferase [Candidatus Methanoperedens sp.]|nr:glycosyltransferase [Candidatus Methanoperedens sp.]